MNTKSCYLKLTKCRSELDRCGGSNSLQFPQNESLSLDVSLNNNDSRHDVSLVFKRDKTAADDIVMEKAVVNIIHLCDDRNLMSTEKNLLQPEYDFQESNVVHHLGKLNIFIGCRTDRLSCIFQFECDVSMSLRSTPLETKFADGPSPLLEDMGKMYLSEKHSDVRLCINKRKIDYPAHKVVLAAHSSVFEAMFEHNMQENSQNRVEIEGVSEGAFLEVLRYMYAKKIENADELVYDVLQIADQYDIKKLKTLCEITLRDKLSAETAMQILITADSLNCTYLKTSAYEFILKNSKSVGKMMSESDWSELEARPNLWKNLLRESFMK